MDVLLAFCGLDDNSAEEGNMDERLIWLWLSLKIPAGSRVGEKLLSHFGDAQAVYDAERKALVTCGFLNHRYITA